MAKVSISGGIGVGKSRMGEALRIQGFSVLDADEIARNCLNSTTIKAAVIEHFPQLAQLDDSMMRKQLASLVFSDNLALRWLENIIHPCVQKEIDLYAASSLSKFFFVEVPVLAATADYDYKIVVVSPMDLRISRLQQRGLDAVSIFDRINSQPTQDEYIATADFILDGSASNLDFANAVSNCISELIRITNG